jgi:hypothetical protein
VIMSKRKNGRLITMEIAESVSVIIEEGKELREKVRASRRSSPAIEN